MGERPNVRISHKLALNLAALKNFLWFFRRVEQAPELRSDTAESETYRSEMEDLFNEVGELKPETVDHLIEAWREELASVSSSIDATRARAAQLLAITGFLSVLVSISTVPALGG